MRSSGEDPILWTDTEPARLDRDKADIAAFAPEMVFIEPQSSPQTHGGWSGPIPAWPFDRDEPVGLNLLLGDSSFEVAIIYPSAYPMTPPRFFPLNVEPEPEEHSQSKWHVAPDGFLCLLQSTGGWIPEASPTELIAKAAGWRIEYALMKAGARESMTVNGIVSDASLDQLIAETASQLVSSIPEREADE